MHRLILVRCGWLCTASVRLVLRGAGRHQIRLNERLVLQGLIRHGDARQAYGDGVVKATGGYPLCRRFGCGLRFDVPKPGQMAEPLQETTPP